jgi:hypothetical protein
LGRTRPLWIALLLVPLLVPGLARPLPLYSRSLGVACATCHDVVPRLNPEGIAFAQRGYLFDAHGHSTRPGALALSAVGGAGVSGARDEPERPSAADAEHRAAFTSLELVAAGAPAPRLSYHLDAGLDHTGLEVHRGDDFVQLSVARPGSSLALRAGRFAAELPSLSADRRLTLARYLTPVAYGARGLELDGAHAAWTAAAGLSLSDRMHAGGVEPRAIAPPLEDTYFQLGRRFGAEALGAQMLFDRQDSTLPTLSWLQHLRCEVAAQFSCARATLVPAYVFDRFDDRPAPGVHERHQYLLLEGIVPLGAAERWIMTARYEHDYRTRNAYDPEQHRQQGVLQLAWQAVPSARLGVECARTDDRLARQGRADVNAFAQASW